MYIRTPMSSWLGQPPSCQPVAGYQAPFSTGGQYIGEKDSAKLLTILSGPSPYQKYIQQVMTSKAAAQLPRNFLRIISSPKEVPDREVRERFVKTNNKIVGGTIDRRTGTIYLLELPSVRGYTRLEFALHEAVHLFAHPFMTPIDDAVFQTLYGRGCTTATNIGSFQKKYCFGIGEGATQAITEQIMECQGISKFYAERPYDNFTPPVYEMIRIFSIDKFARAYFRGEIREFTNAMEFRWGNAWINVGNYTSTQHKDLALDEIKRLELAFRQRIGDFPTPSPYIRALS
jgi:hypothetical protein